MLLRGMMAGSVGGGVTAVTWSPTDKHPDIALSAGNLTATKSAAGSAWVAVRATQGYNLGKWYFEVANSGSSAYLMVGVADAAANLGQFLGQSVNSRGYYSVTGQKSSGNVLSAYGATYASGDVIGVAYDASTGSLQFYKNNVSQGVAFTGITGVQFPAVSIYEGSSTKSATGRFKAADFSYTPPSGYSAWE